ncbi:hypothetical protein C8Q70DRAFT_907683 [Cubamyces menziesii]|nr:hypothetical protein C8Q70DRAFT_907683 [Cubamyces menziesii]
MDRNTGKSRGFGYVSFATTEAVQAALKLNGKEIDGRAVNIDISEEKDKSAVREKRAEKFGDTPSEPSSVLFVGNLSWDVTEDKVWEVFGEYGDVKSVRLPTDRESGRPKGFGYVEFSDIEAAKKAYEGLAGTEIEGRAIRLDFSQPRDSNGGGRGGRGGGRVSSIHVCHLPVVADHDICRALVTAVAVVEVVAVAASTVDVVAGEARGVAVVAAVVALALVPSLLLRARRRLSKLVYDSGSV